jgi:hypothetical protein
MEKLSIVKTLEIFSILPEMVKYWNSRSKALKALSTRMSGDTAVTTACSVSSNFPQTWPVVSNRVLQMPSWQ